MFVKGGGVVIFQIWEEIDTLLLHCFKDSFFLFLFAFHFFFDRRVSD